ncbi:MAG: glycine cleavage system aminomethyltransferase GcvT [Deltaproteobacteria bacterium]|nr:glycine cleavage system aminomethyltransferase GcvT [Deltaproteobacteria bacterium]
MKLTKTPLYDWHVKAGAKMAAFAGYAMPISYQGVLEEHKAVRERCGLFDVSHMGEFFLQGPDAVKILQHLFCNDVQSLKAGRAQYTLLLNEQGGVVDDLIYYRLGEDRFLICVNASNVEKDFQWMQQHFPKQSQASFKNESEAWALLALQGPKSVEVLKKLGSDFNDLAKSTVAEVKLGAIDCILACTGYTGEKGCEIFVKNSSALTLWQQLLEAGREFGIVPIGLGARDTLRLEMAYPLYGHELNDHTTPWEAGLAWVVKLNKEEFIGKPALLDAKAKGLKKLLKGFVMIEPGIAREGYRIFLNKQDCGVVTSGTWSPSLEQAVFLAYVENPSLQVSTEVFVDIRGKMKKAKCVSLPFI